MLEGINLHASLAKMYISMEFMQLVLGEGRDRGERIEMCLPWSCARIDCCSY